LALYRQICGASLNHWA